MAIPSCRGGWGVQLCAQMKILLPWKTTVGVTQSPCQQVILMTLKSEVTSQESVKSD